ncbi:MAG: ABC transporter ATP-binding protein [Pseudomonadota bacterium]
MTETPDAATRRGGFGVLVYTRRALELVWTTSPALTLWLGALTLGAGLLPAGVAYLGKLIVDAVVAAIADPALTGTALIYVAAEGVLVAALALSQRGIALCQALLRAQLGNRINVLILDKALTLSLAQFEDPEFYDKLNRARREASSRPLSLVNRTFTLARNGIALIGFAVLLLQFSPWAVLLLALAGLPAFVAETRFSGQAYELSRRRSPDTRKQWYLETVLAREDHAKEVKLFRLGRELLARYQGIFRRIYAETRNLTIRRESWGFVLGLLGTLAFYGAYAWIAVATIRQDITLGDMTMYLMVFKQGQTAVSAILTAISGMYEDNLYLSNLYEYLEQPAETHRGIRTEGAEPGSGVRFEQVSFTYPGSVEPALVDISLTILPGQSLALVGENGAGKTTLIKLMTGLYPPGSGRVLLDGTPLTDWSREALDRRFGVIFQDFARYQMTVGENIGAGDVEHFTDTDRWAKAATKGLARDFIADLPGGYETQLGRWFQSGQELSIGQWQKIALSRAFMDESADVLILDEPTAAMDARAEAAMFEHFRSVSRDKITVLISHRFSTVRQADRIVVIAGGRIAEQGSHDELMSRNGHYATLFRLQAAGYQ